MKKFVLLSAFILAAGHAQASCFADYKAKRDNPLKLHYGIVELRGACNKGSAAQEIATRIGDEGWQLLNVLSVFDETQLEGKKGNAGQFYLRY